MTLTTGEVLDIDFAPVAPSAMSFVHNIACVDTMSKITCGDLVGIANFETTHNGQQGTRRPIKLSRGFIENGWHPAT
jgi:hypothetical protein